MTTTDVITRNFYLVSFGIYGAAGLVISRYYSRFINCIKKKYNIKIIRIHNSSIIGLCVGTLYPVYSMNILHYILTGFVIGIIIKFIKKRKSLLRVIYHGIHAGLLGFLTIFFIEIFKLLLYSIVRFLG